MLDLVLVVRIVLIALTGFHDKGAIMNEEKNKWDWYVIIYLAVILVYMIMR